MNRQQKFRSNNWVGNDYSVESLSKRCLFDASKINVVWKLSWHLTVISGICSVLSGLATLVLDTAPAWIRYSQWTWCIASLLYLQHWLQMAPITPLDHSFIRCQSPRETNSMYASFRSKSKRKESMNSRLPLLDIKSITSNSNFQWDIHGNTILVSFQHQTTRNLPTSISNQDTWKLTAFVGSRQLKGRLNWRPRCATNLMLKI